MFVFRAVFAAILFGGFTLLFMPALNIQSLGFVLTVFLIGVLTLAIPSRDTSSALRVGNFAIPALALIILALFASSGMLRSQTYFSLLGEEKTGNFSATLPPLNLQKAGLVSEKMAKLAAEKRLSEIPALGSQVSVGQMEKQLVRGELVWVAFLEHRDFFKWWSQESTPGYLTVSAHDPSVVHLVTELHGKKLHMKYLESAFFGSDLDRHVYFNGFATKMVSDFIPEIDDEGRPFLVAAVYDKKVMFGGRDVVGAVVVDVQTGQTTAYAMNDVPAWIDRIQPEDIIKSQLADRLHLVHGWLNPSDKDRLAISGSLDIVYGGDGRAYFFAGHTSVAREGGMVGFSLIDSRNKQATRYAMSGITEKIAQAAAEGVYPEKRYHATNALPYVLDGHPVYVMALTDDTGISRAYAMVSIEDAQKVAVADTLAAASRQFQARMTTDRTRLDSAAHVEARAVKAKVLRKGSEVRGGNTSYLLVLEGQAGLLFAAGPDLSEELAVTNEGDLVEVQFAKGSGRVVGLLSFHNLALGAKPAAPQAAASAAAVQ